MKKRTLSLLEIMIVILLISLITGAIGYSMKGTLDKGRAFRSEQGKDLLHDLLLMCAAEGRTMDEVEKEPEKWIRHYGLAKNPDKLLKDGWGHPFTIRLNQFKTDFLIESTALNAYKDRMKPQSTPEGTNKEA